jgi:hypothetical protein
MRLVADLHCVHRPEFSQPSGEEDSRLALKIQKRLHGVGLLGASVAAHSNRPPAKRIHRVLIIRSVINFRRLPIGQERRESA